MSARPALVLHIGAMKTGTTYLQNLLHANADVLGEAGWAVPEQRRVVPAVRQVMNLTDGPGSDPHSAPRWEELVARARQHDGLGTVVSMEFLSYARRPRLLQILESTAGLEVHVVLTVRDAMRALPSQWQSLSRNGGVTSWPDFAGAVRTSEGSRSSRSEAVKAFRRTQDIPRMIEVWSDAAPPGRFSAITVPAASSPRSLLWERFLGTLGVDPFVASAEADFDNPQLGYGSCELLRRLNAAGLQGKTPSAYRRVMRRLARGHLLGIREQQSRPCLDPATAEFAVGLNARTRAEIGRSSTLVGDVDDLPIAVPADLSLDDGPRPAQVGREEVHRAAQAMHAGVLALGAERDITVPEEMLLLPDDVDRAVEQLAVLVSRLIAGEVSHREQQASG